MVTRGDHDQDPPPEERGTPRPTGPPEPEVRVSVHMLEALKSSQELCHTFMEDTDDLVVRLDGDARLLYANRAAEAFFGLTPHACLGLSLFQFIHPDDRVRMRREFEACLMSRRPGCAFESRQVSRSGRERDVSWSARAHRGPDGKVASLTAIARDVTEQKRLIAIHERFQQALLGLAKQKAFSGRDLNAALKAITETSAHALGVERVGVWLFRDNKARIQCVNLYQRSTNQHQAGLELAASDAPDYFRALEFDRVIAEVDAPQAPRTRQLGRYLRDNGIGAMMDAPIHTEGALAGIVCHEHVGGRRDWSIEEQNFAASIGDMVSMVVEEAERKRVELEMLRQTIELEKAQELSRMKSEFINTVAHELRTPLTSIIGLVEFLEEGVGGELPPQQRKHVGNILSNLQRLTRLVNDLMDMARLQVGTFKLQCQEVDLGRLIEASVASQRPQADAAGIGLGAEPPDQPVVLTADPVRLDQVLANLLSNALKFTPKGGRVSVRLRDEGGQVRIEVTDTGVAIAPEDIPKLFQRFAQLDGGEAKGGLGLGLSISKGLVEAHGGQIGVESQPGAGSTFWFSLPRRSAR